MNSNPLDCYYVFDSNILLPILGLPSEGILDEKYQSFFDAVYKKAIDEKTKVQILYTDVQLSELMNRLLRYSSDTKKKMDSNYDGLSVSKYYKDIFRPSEGFVKEFARIKSDFEDYQDAFARVSIQGLNTISDYLSFDTTKLDFNDNIIYNSALENGAILITNDKDFYGLDITLGTFNQTMIKMFRNQIKPINK